MEYNGVKIEKLDSGKWLLTDTRLNETREYRTEHLARKIAQTISDENDMIDKKDVRD